MLEQYIQNNYLRSLVILVLVFVILRFFVYLVSKILLSLTEKTKTDLDDIILKKSSKPLSFVILVIGLRLALNEIPLSQITQDAIFKIVHSLIIVAVSYLAYSLIDLFLFRGWKKFVKKTESRLDDSLVHFAQGVLKFAWIVTLFLYLLYYWGVEIGPFLAGLGIGGIAVAFALQSTLSNIFGGISLILDRTIRVGDLIYLSDGTQGTIMHIGLRSTKIKTFDNEIVIVPNSKMSEGNIQNVALPEPKTRVVIPFGVAYGSKIEKVKKVVLNELKKISHFVNDPKPMVMFLEMSDSSLNFKAYFYVDSFEYKLSAIDEANTRIYEALTRNKIEIPFPQMDVHLKKK